MTIVLDRVPLDLVERMWPHIEPHIKAGCDAVTTEVTPEFIHAEALADRRTLWVAFDTDSPFPFLAAASVGFRDTNHGRVVFIDAIGGRDGKRWLRQCLADFEGEARMMGAASIEVEGRRGWRKVLPGYREVRTVLEKVL